MIWNREEYMAYMTGHDVGRDMFTELFGPLSQLEAEWTAAGVPEAERDLSAFGWDSVRYIRLTGCQTGAITGMEPRILSDTPIEQLGIDYMGRRTRLCKDSASIPLPLDHPVTTMDDWLRVKHWYEFREDRVDYEQLARAKQLQQQGYLVVADIPGGFDEPRQLLGEAELCVAYYEEPEMIEDMLNTMADTALKVFERVHDYVSIDQLSIHEDMAGKSGPLIGPNQMRTFMKPYYRAVWDEVHRHGAQLFCQDSDGNINSILDDILDCGVNIPYPFEPAAGMDIVAARQKYGRRIATKGGIDKHALRGTREDIRRELEYKLCALTRGGGVAFALDHRIPNGVSMENYKYYVSLGREMLGLPAPTPSPFVRMAF